MEFQANRPSIVIVADCSGSMNGYIGTMTSHIRKLIRNAEAGKINANLGVIAFDDTVYPCKWDGSFNLHHGGGTNLHGACIRSLRGHQQIANSQDKTMFIVITDGQHGSGSDTFRPEDVKSEVLIAEEMLGWDFLFVGTNQNAYQVGTTLGIKPGKALSFANSQQGFDQMLEALADICSRWAGGALAHNDEFFTEQVKEKQSKLGAIVL